MSIDSLHMEIDKRWNKHLNETRKLLRIPSVSMTGEGIEDTAEALVGMLSRMGVRPRLFRATRKSFPLVTGQLDVGADRTVLLYGMYDVQPVGDLDEWDYPPFGATITKMKPYGEVLINRGVYNSKGSLAGTLLAIETMVDKGEMPVNVHFLLEGEEELGGRSLPDYVIKNKAKLSKADTGMSFDYGENADGVPVIALGTKGCVYFDLECTGSPEGGPMEGDIHSSDAVWVHSPVWRLVKAISTLVDDEQRPAVDGFWDDVAPPNEDDIELMAKLAEEVDLDAYKKEMGVARYKFGGSKEEMIRRYLFEPSINIAGLLAGYTEYGTKTILPHKAMVKIDIRTVPNMTIEDTRKKIMDHLRRRGFGDLKMRNYEDYPWSKVSPHAPVSKASIEAMRYHGKEPQVWPTVAGSAPMYVFDQILGMPWGGAGLGHGGRAHAPNEFAVVKGMRDFEKSVVTVFMKYAEIAGPK